MSNCIVTGFDDTYWQKFGYSWVLSLREIAQYKGNIVVFGKDLSLSAKKFLEKFDIQFAKSESSNRINILRKISSLNYDNCVFWDGDVWFQDQIDEIFDQSFEKFLITKNKNFGFMATCKRNWTLFNEFSQVFDLFQDDCLISLYENFQDKISLIDNKYNIVEIFSLSDHNNQFYFGDSIAKVIHPSGAIKYQLDNSNISFCERHKDLIAKWSEKKFPKILLKNQ